jgi:hypothetical protein
MPDSELYYLVEGSVYDGDTLRVSTVMSNARN